MLNLNPVALAVREIFQKTRKFNSRSPKLGQVPSDLVFCMLSKLLFVVDAHTKLEVTVLALAVPKISKSVYWNFGRRPSSWIRPSVRFHNSAASLEPRSTTLCNMNAICQRAVKLVHFNCFSCRPLEGNVQANVSESWRP